MGKAFIWLVGVAIVLFIGYATVVSRVEVPWYQIALWWGYVVSGSLAIITGLVYVALLVKNRLTPLDILDDIRCTYWTLEEQLRITLWICDYSNSSEFKVSCSAQFEGKIVDVTKGIEFDGMYIGNKVCKRGGRKRMVEFSTSNIKVNNPNKSIITVSIKPEGLWATKQKSKEVDTLIVNH